MKANDSDTDLTTETSPEGKKASGRPMLDWKARLKRRLLLAGLSSLIFLFSLKIADLTMGWARQTHDRHWLRLSPNTTVRHHTAEYDYEYSTNSVGIRGPEFPSEKPNGITRVLLLGDSFTAGMGVEYANTVGVQLQMILNKDAQQSPKPFEVISLGRVGSSTIREADLYEKFGAELDPDIVILAVFLGNDLVEILEEQDGEEVANWKPPGRLRKWAYTLYPNFYLELAMAKEANRASSRMITQSEQELLDSVLKIAQQKNLDTTEVRKRFNEIPPDIRDRARKNELAYHRFYSACLEPDRIDKSLSPDNELQKTAWPRLQRHLERLREFTRRDNAQLFVIMIPEGAQVQQSSFEFLKRIGYKTDESWKTTPVFLQTQLEDWCQAAEIPCLDLTESLRNSTMPVYFPWDGHWNSHGHRLAAERMADTLGIAEQ